MKKNTKRLLWVVGIAAVVGVVAVVVWVSMSSSKGGAPLPPTTTRQQVAEYARTCRGDTTAMRQTLQDNPSLLQELYDAEASCLVHAQRQKQDARNNQDLMWLWIAGVALAGLGAGYMVWQKRQPSLEKSK